MPDYVNEGGLRVAAVLHDFVSQELLPAISLEAAPFWAGLERIIESLTPANRELLSERDRLQAEIDAWHRNRSGAAFDVVAYEEFLCRIGYLLPEPAPFQIDTGDVDPEIATIAAPQLVVPVTNARFALNAANARWGSLYDALYGTDAIPRDTTDSASSYDPDRGAAVIEYAKAFLDESVPLASGRHAEVVQYSAISGHLTAELEDGTRVGLSDPEQLRGFTGPAERPTSILLTHHGLHIELRIDPHGSIGKTDPAAVQDVQLEAAVTTIIDFEDSVAAVDAADKVRGYRNWLGLNRGDLCETVSKNGRSFVRRLNADRVFQAPDGSSITVPGRAVLLARNVGLLMTSDSVIDSGGGNVFEGILDAVITVAAGLPGIRGGSETRNSATGSIYIVKPKLHGPAEVAHTEKLFTLVEELFGLPRNTVKVGLMDEERRTTVNLAAAVREARKRIVFINTGFLDRSGDEIHTSLEAGPIVPKARMKEQRWIHAYEEQNVTVGLACGFRGRAQIGKGMWAMPDDMADMMVQKIAHPRSGASTAWVPSPTAATLHAIHYHLVDVASRQAELSGRVPVDRAELLQLPVGNPAEWGEELRQEELDNNLQSILGYVVRWVEQGIGCSKVPDIRNVALMEDRATLRISSQLVANWLRHRIVTPEQVRRSLQRMARVVDAQNAGDPDYRPMADDFAASLGFQAASELVFLGDKQPNGYTEPILHRRRREAKAAQAALRR